MRSGNRDSRALPIPVQEYMGAWEWYDRQVELSQATIRNKNKLVDRRGAAIHVLDRMQDLRADTGTPGK
jgi:hypothetical protein